jgi:hypothetical protein
MGYTLNITMQIMGGSRTPFSPGILKRKDRL